MGAGDLIPSHQTQTIAMQPFILTTTLLTASIVLLPFVRGATLHTDDFQSGTTAGWGGGATNTLQSSGGLTGLGDAFLQIATNSSVGPGSKLATRNNDLAWTGDYTTVTARRVTVDLRSPVTSQPLEIRLVLLDLFPTGERFTSTIAQQVPNDGVWHHYEFSLAEVDLSHVRGTVTYTDMLKNVPRIMLRHDAGAPSPSGSSISATLDLDNIRLAIQRQAADFNDDGLVDADDLTIWNSSFAMNNSGDADGDSDTDGADFLVWQQQFSGDPNPLSSKAAVPEPATWLLLALAVGWVCLRRLLSVEFTLATRS